VLTSSPVVLRWTSPLRRLQRRLRLPAFGVFAVVGVAATVVHGAVAWLLLAVAGPLAANAVGFGVALTVTYLGNYFLTFRSEAAHGPTVVRFLVVSAVTLAVSEWCLVALESMNADRTMSLLLAVAVLPVLRFGLMARQVFVADETSTALGPWLVEVAMWVGAAAIGVLVLWQMAPAGLFDPASELWHLPGGDRGTAVAGMRYYLADDWHWPLLATDDLRAPDGTVIAFTDSLPLLALPVKVLAPVLGSDLNYFPAWFLLTYTLQGPAAVLVLRQLGVERVEALMTGAVAAVCMPSFLNRVGHAALTGQFLVLVTLAATLAVGRGRHQRLALAALGAAAIASVLAHPYLLLMTAPVVVAISLDHWRQGRVDLRRLMAAGGLIAVALGLVFVAGGYLGPYGSMTDYGTYGMNVLSPVWPQLSALWPGTNPILAVGAPRSEGFNWLGLGSLALVVAAAVALAASGRVRAVAQRWNVTLVGFALLTAVAVSHQITYGRNGLLQLNLVLRELVARPVLAVAAVVVAAAATAALLRYLWSGSALLPIAVAGVWLGVATIGLVRVTAGSGPIYEALSPIRASGRLWWPVGLLVVLGAIALLARLPRRVAAPLLVACAIVQFVDTVPVREAAAQALSPTSGLHNPAVVEEAAEAATRVFVEPEFFCTPYLSSKLTILDVIVAASVSTTPIDTAYTARPPQELDCGRTEGLLRGERLDPPLAHDELLVLVPPATRELEGVLTGDGSCRSDGQLVLCRAGWAGVPPAETAPFRPVVAEPITFALGGDSARAIRGDWPAEEIEGRPIPPHPVVTEHELIGDPGDTVVVRLDVRADEAATLVVNDPWGTEHRVEIEPGAWRAHEITIATPSPPTGTSAPSAVSSSAVSTPSIRLELWAETGRPVLSTLTLLGG
jgi:putative flippase GtrA